MRSQKMLMLIKLLTLNTSCVNIIVGNIINYNEIILWHKSKAWMWWLKCFKSKFDMFSVGTYNNLIALQVIVYRLHTFNN